MTLGELLTLIDDCVQVTVCIDTYGAIFDTSHFPKYFMEQERASLRGMKIERIFNRGSGICVKLEG